PHQRQTNEKAAGGVLTAKQAPRRPGTAPALGLRAWEMCHHCIADQLRMGEPTVPLHSWLRNIRSALAPPRDQRHPRRPHSVRAATQRLNVEVLEDRALPSLSYAGSFPVGNLPQAVVTADFNNDGRLDLATANYYDGDVSVLLADGVGGFGAANHFVAG